MENSTDAEKKPTNLERIRIRLLCKDACMSARNTHVCQSAKHATLIAFSSDSRKEFGQAVVQPKADHNCTFIHLHTYTQP
jgi:hypothetical protein